MQKAVYEKGEDNKIIAVPITKVDPHFSDIHDIGDIHEATKKKIKHFFETYKELEDNKWVKVHNFAGRDAAILEIKNGRVS